MLLIDAGNSGTSRSGRYTLTDEEIALSFSIYFNWGYPDYVREALNYLVANSPSCVRLDPNKELTWAQLNKLLAEADSRPIRTVIAANSATPTAVLNFLAGTDDLIVVQRVAENPNTHVATLTRLIRHSSPVVRIAVSEHESTPDVLLMILAQDVDADVRYSLAENARMPKAVLELLSNDSNPYVASRADRTLTRLAPAQIVRPKFPIQTGQYLARST